MRGKIVLRRSGIRRWDWLLILGIMLAPMTGLRIWKAGPAEVLCFIWTLKFLPRRYLHINDTLKFFAAFLAIMLVGALVGFVAAPQELRPTGYLVWLYLAYSALAMYRGLKRNSLEDNETMLNRIASLSVLWYLFLYVYSITVSRYFFGAPLWYANYRYSGGGTNPHQIAILMCGALFVLLRNLIKKRRMIWNAALIAGSVFIIVKTKSATAYLAIALGLFVALYFLVGQRIASRRKRMTLLALEAIVVVVFIVLFYRMLSAKVYDWVLSDNNGIGRLEIFSTFYESFVKSPLVGLGPGVHGRDGAIEFHNTYLEILAATGIVGFSAFLVYSVRVFKKLLSDYMLIPIMVVMYAYGLAGFAMRRLVYWGVMIAILVLGEQYYAKKQNSLTASAQDEYT